VEGVVAGADVDEDVPGAGVGAAEELVLGTETGLLLEAAAPESAAGADPELPVGVEPAGARPLEPAVEREEGFGKAEPEELARARMAVSPFFGAPSLGVSPGAALTAPTSWFRPSVVVVTEPPESQSGAW
jgi:hypothetical protein